MSFCCQVAYLLLSCRISNLCGVCLWWLKSSRARVLKQTTVSLVGLSQLQHAAKLRLHSCWVWTAFLEEMLTVFPFRGFNIFWWSASVFFPPLFLTEYKQPNVIAERSSDKLFPVLPSPKLLIKYWNVRSSSTERWLSKVLVEGLYLQIGCFLPVLFLG